MVEQALSAGFDVVGIGRSANSPALFAPYSENQRISKFTYHQLDLNENTDEIIALLRSYRPSYVVDFAGQEWWRQVGTGRISGI